jgi:hypothetical protein
MHDDEFSNIIGSGTEHRVSVSEFTGNAKTPQNNVSSYEEEIQARKQAFEAQELAALKEKKALADALAEHNAHALPQAGSADANIQKIAADKVASNRQTTDPDTPQDNIQSLSNDKTPKNSQNLAADKAVTNNRQSIDQTPAIKNVQGISTEPTKVNTQVVEAPNNSANRQTIEGDAYGQNNQAVGVDAASLNRQALPPAAPATPNRQSVGNGNLQSHFETLPASNSELKKVDFPANDKPPSALRPNAKVGTADALRKPVNKPVPTPRVPMTAEEMEESKRQRGILNDAFHGRLAGIKHNVEELNDRLTDFEEKVQKDDAKLIKGNPDDFKVDLG